MPGADSRPGDRHKRKPIGYRPPADVWPLLDALTERSGRGPSAIITEALRAYLAKPEGSVMPPPVAQAGASGAATEEEHH